MDEYQPINFQMRWCRDSRVIYGQRRVGGSVGIVWPAGADILESSMGIRAVGLGDELFHLKLNPAQRNIEQGRGNHADKSFQGLNSDLTLMRLNHNNLDILRII